MVVRSFLERFDRTVFLILHPFQMLVCFTGSLDEC